MWMTSCTGSVRGGFWGFWKKSQLSWVPGQEEDSWLSGQARGLVAGAARDDDDGGGGGDGKARIERMCIPLLMSKNL